MASQYHEHYLKEDEEQVARRLKEKADELRLIFEQVEFNPPSKEVKLAVLGCGEKRIAVLQPKLFEEELKVKIQPVTFDINIDHLQGLNNVYQHDCTQPLLMGPFDITYAHVLLKFIETEKQWDLIKNSYDVLNPGGIAIHVFDKEDYETEAVKLNEIQFSVPLKRWEGKLKQEQIKYYKIPVKYGLALVLKK